MADMTPEGGIDGVQADSKGNNECRPFSRAVTLTIMPMSPADGPLLWEWRLRSPMLISPVFAHIPIGETAGFGFALVLPVIGIYLALYFLFIRPYQEPMKERRFVYILKTKIQKYISFNR